MQLSFTVTVNDSTKDIKVTVDDTGLADFLSAFADIVDVAVGPLDGATTPGATAPAPSSAPAGPAVPIATAPVAPEEVGVDPTLVSGTAAVPTLPGAPQTPAQPDNSSALVAGTAEPVRVTDVNSPGAGIAAPLPAPPPQQARPGFTLSREDAAAQAAHDAAAVSQAEATLIAAGWTRDDAGDLVPPPKAATVGPTDPTSGAGSAPGPVPPTQ